MINLDEMIDDDGVVHFPKYLPKKLNQLVLQQHDKSVKTVILDISHLIGYVTPLGKLIFELKCETLIIKDTSNKQSYFSISIFNDNHIFDIEVQKLPISVLNVVNMSYDFNTKHTLTLNESNVSQLKGYFHKIKKIGKKLFIPLFTNQTLKPVICENVTFQVAYNHYMDDEFKSLINIIPQYFSCDIGRFLLLKVDDSVSWIILDKTEAFNDNVDDETEMLEEKLLKVFHNEIYI